MKRNYSYKFIIILVLMVCGLLIPTKDSFASNPKIIGFIIEAAQMEGSMEEPVMVTGDTAEQKDRPMLELNFSQLKAEGLSIKKLVQSPKGIVTIDMSPKETVLFNNLALQVTNAEFTENYLPADGNIGLKNIKLLAHHVSANNSNLPQFSLNINEGGQVEMEPKSEEELLQMKAFLKSLISNSQQ
ncbi:hypothetical protein [Neobacillus drentensis]|uniref:hypothetical protein n=1 Tax=Neobacillus drentensis TaxID=220684 RepID=UPI003000BC01